MNKQSDRFGKRFLLLKLFLLVGLILFGAPHQVQAGTYITVTEEIDQLDLDPIIKFAVDTDYDNIVAFAVSHISAMGGNAGISEELVPPEFAGPPDDWYPTTIEWDAGNSNWKEYSTDRVIGWLGSSDLSTGQGAWLFTCYDGSPDYGEALWSPGTTGGFYGRTDLGPMSDFAAYDNEGSGTTLTGETTVIPLPGSLLLLGSGLVGLVGLRRKLSGWSDGLSWKEGSP